MPDDSMSTERGVMSPRDIAMSRMRIELDPMGQRRYPDDAAIEAELARRQSPPPAETGVSLPSSVREEDEIVEGQFRPAERLYPGVRVDLEAAKNGYLKLSPEGKALLISRLTEAGFNFDDQNRPIDPGDIEHKDSSVIVQEVKDQLRFYRGIRADLETAARGYQGLNEDREREVRNRLKGAGILIEEDGRLFPGYSDLNITPEEEVHRAEIDSNRMAYEPINVGEPEPEPDVEPEPAPAVEPEPEPVPEPPPAPEVDSLKEMFEHEAQEMMECMGAYTGGDYNPTDPDLESLRRQLEAAGVSTVDMDEQQVRAEIWSRRDLAKRFLTATNIPRVEIDGMVGEELMLEAQNAYFRLLTSQADQNLINNRDALTDESFDRRGYDSTRRKGFLENMKTRLGNALDREITGMDFYDRRILAHTFFLDNYRQWLFGDIEPRIARYKELTKDGGIREKFSRPTDWIRAVREALVVLEGQQAMGNIDSWLDMKVKLETTGSGFIQNVAIFESMDAPELAALKSRLEAEVTARAGIDAAYKIWDSKRTDANGLVTAMYGRVGSEKEEAPSKKLEFFSMGWLEALASAEGELGTRIGRAMQKYIAIGERDLHRHYVNQELKEVDITPQRRAELTQWLVDNPPVGTNIFSDKETNDVAAERIRRGIASDSAIGSEAEELAFRLMRLFGLGAKYCVDQSVAGFGCYYRDDLASLMRPNDVWQSRDRVLADAPIGPREIVGTAGIYPEQPMRNYGFMVSYPDQVGEVIMKNGTVMSMMRALGEGRFAEIDWREIPSKYQYPAFVRRMETARKAKTYLLALPPGGTADYEPEALATKMGVLRTALTEYRTVVGEEIKPQVTSARLAWNKREYVRASGFNDDVTQFVMMCKMMAIARSHDPRRGVKAEDEWNMVHWTTMRRNLSKILAPQYLEFLNFANISAASASGAFTLAK